MAKFSIWDCLRCSLEVGAMLICFVLCSEDTFCFWLGFDIGEGFHVAADRDESEPWITSIGSTSSVLKNM